MYIFGPKRKICYCDGTPPHLHIKCSLYGCTSVQRSKIFKQNSNILICSIFIDFWLGGAPCMCAHARLCMHMHTCINIIISCKWLLSWHREFPGESCYNIITHMCARMHVYTCTCTCVWGIPPKHPDRVTPPATHLHPTPKGGPLKSFKSQ